MKRIAIGLAVVAIAFLTWPQITRYQERQKFEAWAAKQPPDATFEQNWNTDVGKVALTSVGPRKVFTESIIPTPTVKVATVEPEEVALPKPHKVKKHERKRERKRDVCQRHGQRKVFVGKYRWRCKR